MTMPSLVRFRTLASLALLELLALDQWRHRDPPSASGYTQMASPVPPPSAG